MMYRPQSPVAPICDNVYKSTNVLQIQQICRIGIKVRNLYTKRAARGYALLLAVLITSTVLSAATALASIVIAEIRQTREVAAAIVAYAQAEEKVDKAIFMLRHTDRNLGDIADQIARPVIVEPEERPQYFQIDENDFVSLSIPEDAIVGESPQITITNWELANERCVSWIEVSSIAWNANAIDEDPFTTFRQLYAHSDFSGTGNLNIPFGVTRGTPLEMRIRSLYCDIKQLGVSGIPGRVRIFATGISGNVQQAVETHIVRNPPAGSFADFAIFSECSVIKGEALSPDCPQ